MPFSCIWRLPLPTPGMTLLRVSVRAYQSSGIQLQRSMIGLSSLPAGTQRDGSIVGKREEVGATPL